MWLGGFRNGENELGRIAVAAARKDKFQDALRLWKIYANLDRRDLAAERSGGPRRGGRSGGCGGRRGKGVRL